MMNDQPKNQKQSFCRFYLRGLCIYNSKDCPFAHGVWDLNFDYWKEGEKIEYDYHKTKDEAQKNTIKGHPIYKDLYEFQEEKIFTLEDFAQNRPIRSQIRHLMYHSLYHDFMQLLEIKYPGTLFTENFLIREFTRVGFNKIYNGPLKLNQMQSYLCDYQGRYGKYFKTTKNVPPENKKEVVLIKKAEKQQIIDAYRKQYLKIIGQSEKPIEQSVLKKKMFTAVLPDNVPPLNLILKDWKVTLGKFIEVHLGQESGKIVFETSIQVIVSECENYLAEKLQSELVSWNEIYLHLCKVLKTNNGNVLNQAKPYLVQQHNAFLFFPMTQFIYNPKVNSKLFSTLKQAPCKCSFQKPFTYQELLIENNYQNQLEDGASFDIYNFDTLMECAPHILNSKIIGVDLEGHLRKGGFVEMVQLNNGRNTFLFDIWHMNELGEFDAFWLARKILRNVMVDPKIVKIFHDCRHDSIGLHQMLQTCIVNVIDTSATETLINQLQLYHTLWQDKKGCLNQCKQIITNCNNVKTPGLNQILQKYKARHGINKNKQKFHKMWAKGEVSFFCKRPIDPDYRQYCIKDVLDLPQVYEKMVKLLPGQSLDLAFWISGMYAKQGYLSISEEKQEKLIKHQ